MAEVNNERGLTSSRRRLAVVACTVGVGVVFLLGWELGSRAGLVNAVYYSKPSDIVVQLVSAVAGEEIHGRTLYAHLWITGQAVVIGYVIGSVAGILVGFGVGRSELLTRAFEPYVMAFFAIPKISLAPLFVLILGIGLTSKVAIVFIESFFILFSSTLRGVREINEEFVYAAKIMGASRGTVLRRILLPASLPAVFSGLQLAVPFAVIGAVIGEYIASNRGLGWYVLYSGTSLDATGLFTAIAVLVVLTWALTRVVSGAVRVSAPWLPRER